MIVKIKSHEHELNNNEEVLEEDRFENFLRQAFDYAYSKKDSFLIDLCGELKYWIKKYNANPFYAPNVKSRIEFIKSYIQKSESKSYRLSSDLGPQNLYDTIAGNAQIIAHKNNDIHLLNLSIELSELIIKYPYNHDMFYKVIVKAKEIEKYINENLSNEKIKFKSGLAKTKEGNKFRYPSKLEFSNFAGFYEIKLGNYKFDKEIGQVLTEDLITKIKDIAFKMFPELDSETSTRDVASTEFKEYSNAKNTYTDTERGRDKVSYSEFRRDHENLKDIGRIIVFKFPTSIPLDKIENFFQTVVELIQVEANSDILYDVSSEKKDEDQTNFDRIYETIRELIMDENEDEYNTKLYEIDELLYVLVFNKNITANNFIEILKLIENNKTNLQIDDYRESIYKRMLATKKYLSKLDQKIEDIKTENDFFNFLVTEGFESSETKNMFIYNDIDVDLKMQKIVKEYPECEIIIDEDKESVLIKFPTSKEIYSYIILVSFPLFKDLDGGNSLSEYICFKIGGYELGSNAQ
jgi:hypothetical protein